MNNYPNLKANFLMKLAIVPQYLISIKVQKIKKMVIKNKILKKLLN